MEGRLKASILSLFHEASDISRQYLSYWRKNRAQFSRTELLFGDNGSRSDTREQLRAASDWARSFRFEENLGYAMGNNRLAREAAGEILVFLNNDTLPCDNWLGELLQVFDARPDVQIVGNIQLSVATRLVDHAGVYFDADGKPFHFRPPVGSLSRLRWMPVPAVTGACLAVRRDFFLKLGGFDEGYQNGYEDTDLCLRARAQGSEILLATRSRIWHHIASSPGRHHGEARNQQRFHDIWNSETRRLSQWAPPQLTHGVSTAYLPLLSYQTLQVFLPTPEGYSEANSIHRPYPKNCWTRVTLELPAQPPGTCLPLRLDPAKRSGTTRLAGLSVRDPADGALLWQVRGKDLLPCVLATGTGSALENGECGILSTGNDPQLLINLPDGLREAHRPLILSLWLKTTDHALPRHLQQPARSGRVLIDLWRLVPNGANGGVKVLALEVLRKLHSGPLGRKGISCVIQPEMLDELSTIIPRDSLIPMDSQVYHAGPHPWLKDFEVLYCPVHSSALWTSRLRRVSTVVDLLHRDHPQSLPPEEIALRERCTVETLAYSDAIQCNSLFVKEALRRHYGIENDRLFVVYNALQHRANRHQRLRPTRRARPYFLYPANTWRHKNHLRLLEAYARYRSEAAAPWDLCLTGTKVGGSCEGLPASTPLPEGCDWLGYLQEKDYFSLVLGAGGLVFPSLYEGFGIPVLEALQFGIPTACSRRCSLPEVGGEHVIYLDPESVDSITEALKMLTYTPKLKREILNRFLDSRFCWENEMYRLETALS